MAQARKRAVSDRAGPAGVRRRACITGQKALVDFFEEAAALGAPAKEAANWMLGDMMRRLKEEELEAKDMRLTPATLAKLIGLVSERHASTATPHPRCSGAFSRRTWTRRSG